jgi:hypothetical protein
MKNMMAMAPRSGKSHYSESEAAEELGVSVDQLRTLIRSHIVSAEDGDSPAPPLATFQPSDLVLLRILAGLQQPVALHS